MDLGIIQDFFLYRGGIKSAIACLNIGGVGGTLSQGNFKFTTSDDQADNVGHGLEESSLLVRRDSKS